MKNDRRTIAEFTGWRRQWVNSCVLTSALICAYFLGIAPAVAIDTIWNFDGNLNAASGAATMTFRADTGTNNVDFFSSEHDLGLPMPFGDHSGVMRFQPTTPSQGLAIQLNNGGTTVRDYTMIWDLFRPGPSWNSWLPLYQTDIGNTTDAEFFINPGDGIGISGNYNGTISNGRGNISWNRIAVTLRRRRNAEEIHRWSNWSARKPMPPVRAGTSLAGSSAFLRMKITKARLAF